MRTSEISRVTAETDIRLSLDLDGRGASDIDTGVGFLDHMLTLLAKHARFDLYVKAKGDNYVDDHHTVEDVGIVLGQAFAEAIGDKKGICRFADCILPMDEALIMCAVDISGRDYLGYALEIPTEKVGTFDTELTEEFLRAFAFNAGITLHAKILYGNNTHHKIEALFKALGHALATAVKKDGSKGVLSTKGIL